MTVVRADIPSRSHENNAAMSLPPVEMMPNNSIGGGLGAGGVLVTVSSFLGDALEKCILGIVIVGALGIVMVGALGIEIVGADILGTESLLKRFAAPVPVASCELDLGRPSPCSKNLLLGG